MKSLTLCILLLLVNILSFGQSTCNNPFPINNMPCMKGYSGSAPVPGVDYACSSQSHYDYFFFKICSSGSMTMEAQGTTAGDIDLVVYGPFNSPGNNCTQFVTANVVGCDTSGMANANIPMGNVNAGDFYVVAVHSASYGQVLFDYTGTAIVDMSCVPCTSTGIIDQICLATVDSVTEKYKLIWTETPNIQTAAYVIFKMDLWSVLQPLDTIPIDSLSQYIDVNSNPAVHTENYYLQRLDSCGNAFTGNYVEPLHLNVAYNQMNQVALSWNNYVCSFNPAINYIIFRGSAPGMELPIDTVPAMVNAYMDLTAPPGLNYYKIGATPMTSCVPTRSAEVAFSNNSAVSVNDVGDLNQTDPFITIYPNPVTDNLHISLYDNYISEIVAFDVSGRVISNIKPLRTSAYMLDVNSFPVGYYFLEIKTEDYKLVRVPFIKN